MKQPSSLLFGISSALFLLVSLYLGMQVYTYTLEYRDIRAEYADELNYEKRLLNVEEWLEGSSGVRAQSQITEALDAYIQARTYAGLLGGLALIYLLGTALGLRKQSPTLLPTALTLVALVCLLVGLFTPMLEIGAFERDLSIPLKVKTKTFSLNLDYTQVFEGDMYFYYQSKSIVELITLLLSQNNYIVGISILIFSVVLPVVKLLITLLGVFSRLKGRLLNKVHLLGKWSMADVFVAAIFLAFLAFNNLQTGIQTESNTLLGLYFFLAYCVLSIGTSQWLTTTSHRV